MCPPAQSAKLKIIYGLKVSKIADFSKVTHIVYMVGGCPQGGGGGQMPPPPPLNETLHVLISLSSKEICA